MACIAINTTNLYASVNELELMGERLEEIARNSKINVLAYQSRAIPDRLAIPKVADASYLLSFGGSLGLSGPAISFSVTPTESINFLEADTRTPATLQEIFDKVNNAGNTLNNTVACGTPGATNLDAGVIASYRSSLADAMDTLNFYISSPLWGRYMNYGFNWDSVRPIDVPPDTFGMDASRLGELREFRDRIRSAYRTLLAARSILQIQTNPEPEETPPPTDPAKCDEIIEAIRSLQIDVSVIVNPILEAINQINCDVDLSPVIEKITSEHSATRETIATEHTATKELVERRAVEILNRINDTRIELREVREDVKVLLTCPCSQPIIDEIRRCCTALELEFDGLSFDVSFVQNLQNYILNQHNETRNLITNRHNETRVLIDNRYVDLRTHTTNEHNVTRNVTIGELTNTINIRHNETRNHVTNQHNDTRNLITLRHNETRTEINNTRVDLRNHTTNEHNVTRNVTIGEINNTVNVRHTETRNHVTNQHNETRTLITNRHNETRTLIENRYIDTRNHITNEHNVTRNLLLETRNILIEEIRRCCGDVGISWPDIAGSHEMPACESPQDDPVWQEYLRAIASSIGGHLAGEILGKYIPGGLDDAIISAIAGELSQFAVDRLIEMFNRFFSDRLQTETYTWSGSGLVGLSSQVRALQRQLNDLAAGLCFDPSQDVQQTTAEPCTPLIVLPPDGDERFTLTSQLQIIFAEQGAVYGPGTSTWRITVPQPRDDLDWCRDIAPLVWQRGAEVYGRLRFAVQNVAWTAGYFGAPGAPDEDLAEDVAKEFLRKVAALSTVPALPVRITKGITPKHRPRRIIVEPIRAAVLLVENGNKRRAYCLKPPAGGC